MSTDFGTCSQVLKTISDRVVNGNVTPEKEISERSSFKSDVEDVNDLKISGQENEIVIKPITSEMSSPNITNRMPILANALTLAASIQNDSSLQKAQIFFVSPGGSMKRKFPSDDDASPKKKPPTSLMPGTTLPYRTPGQSIHNKNGKIKRPMNAFMIWARETRSNLAKEIPNASNAEISVKLGELWNRLPKDEKQKYYMEAERVKARHRQDFPDWIYQPLQSMKKGEEHDVNHRQLWNRYNDTRPKQPTIPTAPVRIAPNPQGQFIHYIGQNRPTVPSNTVPLQQMTLMSSGNRFGYPPAFQVVSPFQQQIINQPFQPRSFFSGNQNVSNAPMMQRVPQLRNFNEVQNVTIIHPKPVRNPVPVPKGRPPKVTERIHVADTDKIANCDKQDQDKNETPLVIDIEGDNSQQGGDIKEKGQTETKARKTQKSKKQEKKQNESKRPTSKKPKQAVNETKIRNDDNDDESSPTTLPGSTTQNTEDHPDDFWPFPFPPAEQESHLDSVFEGPIEDTLEERSDPYKTYFCKDKKEEEKLNVDVSSWQQYLRNDKQNKPTGQAEKLDTYFLEETPDVVNCPSDIDICPVPVALTLTRHESKDGEKLDTSFGNSISDALNVLGGTNEEYDKSDEGISYCDNNTTNKMDSLQQGYSSRESRFVTNTLKGVVCEADTSSNNIQSQVDTRPIKKRSNRYIQSMEVTEI